MWTTYQFFKKIFNEYSELTVGFCDVEANGDIDKSGGDYWSEV